MQPRRYPLSIDLKVKQVCSSCNNGWMSDLENNVLEIISNLHNGRWLLIASEQQNILASWAAKTAVTTQYLNTGPVVPIRTRQWLYTHHTPPPDTAVWITRYDGAGIVTLLSKMLFIRGNPKSSLTPDMQAVFFSIGSLLFIVLSIYRFFEDVSFRTEFPVDIFPHLFKIWPIASPFISWPNEGLDDSLRNQLYNIDWGETLVFRLSPQQAQKFLIQ
jgi:hypothetical protein